MPLPRILWIFMLVGTLASLATGADRNTERFLKNADFAQGDKTPVGWKLVGASAGLSFARDPLVFQSGPACLKVEASVPSSGDLQSEAFYPVPQGEFTLSGFYKASNGWTKASLALQGLNPQNGWSNTAWNVVCDIRPTAQWTPFRAPITLPPQTGAALVHLQLEGQGSLWLDELKIETLDGPKISAEADAKQVKSSKITLKKALNTKWDQVFVGGGGTVTYITRNSNPKFSDQLWAASDIAGPMKYDFQAGTWKHMADQWSIDNIKLQHTELIALDATNPNHVLYSAGKEWQTGQDSIIRSDDGGKTWQAIPLRTRDGKAAMISNGRTGERLQIDPNNGQISYYGSRQNGLFKTTNGGKSWQQMEIAPGQPMDGVGISFVQFDPTSKSIGESKTIYLHLYPTKKELDLQAGLYRSTDAGKSWHSLPKPPRNCALGYVQNDGALYVVGDGLCKWNGSGWSDLTPPNSGGHKFHAFAASPANPQLLALAEDHCGGGNAIQRSRDGGKTWERFSDEDAFGRGKKTVEAQIQTWEGGNNGKHIFQCASSLEFDPKSPQKLWMTYWPGIVFCDDFSVQAPLSWQSSVKGHEEICLFEMACSPKSADGTPVAPLFSGAMDVGGFPHFDIKQMPSHMYVGVELGPWNKAPEDVTDIDFCESDPKFVAIIAGWKYADYGSYPTRNGQGGFSLDGGKTWQKFESKPYDDAKNGKIGVNCANNNNLVWIPRDSVGKKNGGNTPAYVSKDRGQTWIPSKGAPLGLIFDDFVYTFYNSLEADRTRPNTFYIYDSRDGRFYRSDDGGENFHQTSKIASQPLVHFRRHVVRAAPGLAGEVWVAADEQGLYRSSDAGETFTKLDGVVKAMAFGWGHHFQARKLPLRFFWGKLGAIVHLSPSPCTARLIWELRGKSSTR